MLKWLHKQYFLLCIAWRLADIGGVNMNEAHDMAESILSGMDVEFGAKDHCWDRAGAYELADSEMSYWEHC